MSSIRKFRNRNVFGATAFSTYGGFWIGLALYVRTVPRSATPVQVDNDLGWILLAFAIFNFYMLLWATQVDMAVFLVFLTLQGPRSSWPSGTSPATRRRSRSAGTWASPPPPSRGMHPPQGSSTGSPADGSSRSARRFPVDRRQLTGLPAVLRCRSTDHVTRATEGPAQLAGGQG
jgi:GPR1/FUN34/yaaH family